MIKPQDKLQVSFHMRSSPLSLFLLSRIHFIFKKHLPCQANKFCVPLFVKLALQMRRTSHRLGTILSIYTKKHATYPQAALPEFSSWSAQQGFNSHLLHVIFVLVGLLSGPPHQTLSYFPYFAGFQTTFSSLLPIHWVCCSLAEFGLQINASSEARTQIHCFSLLVTQRIWQWVASEDNSKHIVSHSGKRKEAAGRELLPMRYDFLYQQFCQHHPLLMALLSVDLICLCHSELYWNKKM